MKFILTLFAVLATALPSMAADRRKGEVKEAPLNQFEVTIEGVTDVDAQASVKTALSGIKDVKVEEFESDEKECKALLSAKGRLARGDVGKALKDVKGAKITGFKAVRPDKDKKEKDGKDDKKDRDGDSKDKKERGRNRDKSKTEE